MNRREEGKQPYILPPLSVLLVPETLRRGWLEGGTLVAKVEILGLGCARCRLLEELVREVVAEQSVPAEVERVTDVGRIASFGVFSLPGLVIDGKVVATGSVPSKRRIAEWLG